MNTPEKDAAAVKVPPPLVYLAAIAVGFGLQYLWALPLGLGFGARLVLALLIALAGCVLLGAAIRLFFKTGQHPEPWRSTPEIITHGVYRYTRNPFYVGFALIQLAVGVGFGNLWIILLVPVSCVGVFYTAIRQEEAYLTRKFGTPYLEYKQSVRRWL